MNTPVEIILAVSAVGGKIAIAGDRLRMLLPIDCPWEVKAAVRGHKASLLEFLKLELNFLVVESDALKITVFWVLDELTKNALVSAGADPSSIYTMTELQLLHRGRVTVGELPLIHAAKQGFRGRVSEP